MARHIVILASLVLLAGCNEGVAPDEMSCTMTRAFSRPWAELTDAQLAVEVDRACGLVFIGLKEEGAARGVDPQGRSLTSAETVGHMKAELSARGIVIQGASSDLP